MKKTVFVLLFTTLSISAFCQKGDITVGAKGGYVISNTSGLRYNGVLYGLDIAYHISDAFEVAFTNLMNRDIPRSTDNLSIYSYSLDLRLYLIHMQEWATGPALGGQFYSVSVDSKSSDLDDYNYKHMGFNIGWHIRVNLTDNLKLNGGWRYTNVKAKDPDSQYGASFDLSHHLIYLGIAYTFESK